MEWFSRFNFDIQLSAFDYLVLIVNLLLILFARPLLQRLTSAHTPEKTLAFRINMLRGLNAVILIVFGYENVYRPAEGDNHALTALSILAILYLSNFGNYFLQYLIHKQYGKAREVGDKTLYIETYQSRLFSILVAIAITVIAMIAIVRQLGFESLLEAGGVLGVIGVFLALTQASWAPDIISGLIILNSDMFEEGDIIEFDGIVARIYRTKLFHTEIINLTNNHRIMLRNAQMRDRVIHNLSKFATGRGLRECLSFKIGYDTDKQAIMDMFHKAYERAIESEVPIDSNVEPDIKVLDTGDHAVAWGFIYHTKRIEQIINIRRDLREIILDQSMLSGVSLATPITQDVVVHNPNEQA